MSLEGHRSPQRLRQAVVEVHQWYSLEANEAITRFARPRDRYPGPHRYGSRLFGHSLRSAIAVAYLGRSRAESRRSRGIRAQCGRVA